MDVVGLGCPSFSNYNGGRGAVDVFSTNPQLSAFFQRYLLQKAISVFRFKLPESWCNDYFVYSLYCWGFVAVINTDKFGVIPQACGLQGFDVFYRPTNAVISNPLLNGITMPRIGTQCALVKLQPDYGGIMDLVSFYANMMALCATTAGVNLYNSKLSYVFAAGTKAAAASFETMYSDIAKGKPVSIVDKNLFNADGSPAWQLFQQNVGQNYIANKLIDDLRKWEQRFDTAIGIPNANTEKRERLNVDEVNANNVETRSLCELWLEELRKGFAIANKMFGLELAVDWRDGFQPERKAAVNGQVIE